MHRTYQVPSPLNSPSPSPSPRQNKDKAIMQRHYREKEGECFNALRDVINQLTGEELQTRQELLRKAIDLLSSVLEMRRQEQSQAVPPAQYEMPAPVIAVTDPADVPLARLDYSAHSSYHDWPQPGQNAEFDAQSAEYTAQSHVQQYHSMSDIDSAYYQEFNEAWPNNPQL